MERIITASPPESKLYYMAARPGSAYQWSEILAACHSRKMAIKVLFFRVVYLTSTFFPRHLQWNMAKLCPIMAQKKLPRKTPRKKCRGLSDKTSTPPVNDMLINNVLHKNRVQEQVISMPSKFSCNFMQIGWWCTIFQECCCFARLKKIDLGFYLEQNRHGFI